MTVLCYDRPSTDWLDGLPLGNGVTGAMVLAGRDGIRLQLNDGRAWSGGLASEHRRGAVSAGTATQALGRARSLIAAGRHVEAEQALTPMQARYSQAYLPFADLLIGAERPSHRGEAAEGAIERSLNLRAGVHVVRNSSTAGEVTHESFVSADDGVLVHRVRSDVPISLTLRLSTQLFELGRTVDDNGAELRLRLPADVAPGHEPDEPPVTWQLPDITPLEGALAVGWSHNGWMTPSERPDDLRFDGATELLVIVATEVNSGGIGRAPVGNADTCAATASARVLAASVDSYDLLKQRHTEAHSALMDRVSLSFARSDETSTRLTDERVRSAHQASGTRLADPALISLLFDYGRYLLVSSSRSGGFPATLQGLWNEQMQPPWSSNYTLNINTEMNYWGAEPSALPETQLPLIELVEALASAGQATADRLYACRGWVAHHNTDAWAFSSPTAGDASWAHWPLGGVWLVLQLDQMRRFGSADAETLERLWQLSVGAAEFCLDWLIDDEGSGTLVTRPSTSPENRFQTDAGPAAVTTASGMDRAMILELFRMVSELAREIGAQDHSILREIEAAAPRIAPPTADENGVVEWWPGAVETDPQHRHLSHLYPAFPGTDSLDDRMTRAVSTTLDRRGDDSTGWSLVWKLCLRARLGQADRVRDLLRLFLRPASAGNGAHAGGLYDNLFAAHPPFQIDGNLGFVGAVAEMLLQSHRDEIELLPALPAELGDGSFTGLIARPGVRVDLAWAAGAPRSVALTAVADRASGTHVVRFGDRRLRVDLELGDTLTFEWPDAATAAITTATQQRSTT